MKSLSVYQISFEYVSKFLDCKTFNFWELVTFSSAQGFYANNFISRNDTMFTWWFTDMHFFKALKTIDFSTRVPKLLFRDCLLKLLKFKIGPSLGLPCLLPSMFKIIYNYINYSHNLNKVQNLSLIRSFLPNGVHV